MSEGQSSQRLDPRRLETLVDLFDQRVRKSPSRVAYRQYLDGVGRWHGYSWADVSQRVRCWQDALLREGLAPGDRVAIMVPNRPDWVAVDIAALSLGLVVVALFIGDRPGSSAHTLADSGAKLLVVEEAQAWLDIQAHSKLPQLQRIVSLSAGMPHGDGRSVNLSNWLPMPEETSVPPADRRPGPDDLAVICYTSGTTGLPKGVMLSHRNILSNVLGCYEAVPVRDDDVMLSFLPLAHMFERTAGYYNAMYAGIEIAFTRGVDHLREDFAAVRPTTMVSVPRIFERFYALLTQRVSRKPWLLRLLFRLCLSAGWKRHLHHHGQGGTQLSRLTWHVLEPLVARPALAVLGGRLRLAISGGAPLAPQVSRLFIALGVPVLQGYGLTEAGPVVSTNRLDDNDPESVGRPLKGVETKVGVDGELFVRGPGVMMGYWNDPETTAKVLSSDGWLSTGDQVSRLQSDRIYVTGRIKELIVMSNGEKAAPMVLEQLLLTDPLVEQIMILGEARPYLVALMVPDAAALDAYAAENGVGTDGEAMEGLLLERFARQLDEMPKFAQVRRVGLVSEPWTVANRMATPTHKLCRRRILHAYTSQINAMYEGHFLAPTTEVGYHVDVG